MSDNSRAIRLGESIKIIVATMLEQRIKDPRLGFITVTDVDVTGDLQHATVFTRCWVRRRMSPRPPQLWSLQRGCCGPRLASAPE